jgi:hypothetical protein
VEVADADMVTPLGARTRLILTSLLAAATILLAACGGSDDPKADPSPPSSATGSASPTTDTSATSSVTPATGKSVDTSAFTANVPSGWQVQVLSKDFSILAYDPKTGDQVSFYIVSMAGNDFTLRQLAGTQVRTGPWSGKPTIEAETTLAGQPAYHLTGEVSDGVKGECLGAPHDGNDVGVIFQVSGSDAKLQQIEESVLATWQWK